MHTWRLRALDIVARQEAALGAGGEVDGVDLVDKLGQAAIGTGNGLSTVGDRAVGVALCYSDVALYRCIWETKSRKRLCGVKTKVETLNHKTSEAGL